MLTASYIFFELESSTLVSDLYGLILDIFHAIGKTLCYHKKDIIWRLIFVCTVFSENEFISNFIVIVNSMFILLSVISIGFRIFF